jgi:hypothetical protein
MYQIFFICLPLFLFFLYDTTFFYRE